MEQTPREKTPITKADIEKLTGCQRQTAHDVHTIATIMIAGVAISVIVALLNLIMFIGS